MVSKRRTLLELCAPALELAGEQWAATPSWSSALEYIRERNVDFVLVDTRSRKSQSWSIVRGIRSVRANTRVILMGDSALPSLCGEDGYLEVPFDPWILALMIREMPLTEAHPQARPHPGLPSLFAQGRPAEISLARDFLFVERVLITSENVDTFSVSQPPSWKRGVPPGTAVSVTVESWDGLYTFHTAVVAVREATAVLAKPRTLNRIQRRTHPRRELDPPAELVVEGWTGAPRMRILNHSVGGMMLDSSLPVDAGSTFRFRTTGEPGLPRAGEAWVVWSKPSNGGARLGVKYWELAPEVSTE
ncbi:MAG: PilZ domain-containing protein [Armatimonadota bacterium]